MVINMKRIKSFEVDHNTLQIGMYISRIDDDIVTYDLRMVKPNGGVYLDSAGMHTVEHLMATFLRNSEFEKNIIYFGPMGCRTGFYFLQRGMSHQDAIILVRQALDFVINFRAKFPVALQPNAVIIKNTTWQQRRKWFALCGNG